MKTPGTITFKNVKKKLLLALPVQYSISFKNMLLIWRVNKTTFSGVSAVHPLDAFHACTER